jgi:hypothetical protein
MTTTEPQIGDFASLEDPQVKLVADLKEEAACDQ